MLGTCIILKNSKFLELFGHIYMFGSFLESLGVLCGFGHFLRNFCAIKVVFGDV